MNVTLCWLAWFLRRCRKVVPYVLTLFAIWGTYNYLISWPGGVQTGVTVLPQIPLQSSTIQPSHSQWLIICENRDLCNLIKSNLNGWNIVFVATQYISPGSNFSCQILPVWIENSRQSAFLFAINRGADIIYVVEHEVDLRILRHGQYAAADSSDWGLMYTSDGATSVFDVVKHYGCSNGRQTRSTKYKLCNARSALLAPVLVDAHTELICDDTAPLLMIEAGSYMPLQLTDSVFKHSAFWALPALGSIVRSYTTEWSYVVQWMLWQTGNVAMVYIANVNDGRFSNSTQQNLILQFLSRQKCESEFVTCIISVVQKMASAGLVQFEFVEAVQYWLYNLTRTGYAFPQPKQSAEVKCFDSVIFSPVEFGTGSSDKHGRFIPAANVNKSMMLYDKLCSKHQSEQKSFNVVVDFLRPWHQFKDILLVVTFNDPHYEVIPYIEIIYRSIFPQILYCGPVLLDLTKFPSLKGYNISFTVYDASVQNLSGALSYECAIRVARLNYRSVGFLFASDDLLLLPVPLSRLARDAVWFIPVNEVRVGDLKTLYECRLGMCDFYARWDWWQQYKDATISALQTLIAGSSSSSLFRHCVSELKRLNGDDALRANGGYSDVFYIPATKLRQFAPLAEVFLKAGVFVEIAVPTILRCLELPESVQPLPGKQIWTEPRNEPWLYFTRPNLFGKSYLHPVKWSPLINGSVLHTAFFCSYVVPYMHDPFSRLHLNISLIHRMTV